MFLFPDYDHSMSLRSLQRQRPIPNQPRMMRGNRLVTSLAGWLIKRVHVKRECSREIASPDYVLFTTPHLTNILVRDQHENSPNR